MAATVSARVSDADAPVGRVPHGRPVVLDPEVGTGHRAERVELTGDAELFCELSGAFKALARADEHALRKTVRPGDHIHQPVHPVAQVNIENAARPIEQLRARGAPAVRVAGGVLLAAVGLGLGYAQPDLRAVGRSVNYELAEKLRRDLEAIAVEKFCSKPHFASLAIIYS